MGLHLNFLIWAATAFAVLSPVIFIAIREAIKLQRQEIITDLAAVFDVGESNNLHLIPSFEFVKYKYFVGARRSGDPEPSGSDVLKKSPSTLDIHRKREDYSTISWIIGCSPFCAVTGIGMYYVMSIALHSYNGQIVGPEAVKAAAGIYPAPTSFGMMWLLGICAAFAGGYITALRNFYRAVKNFDLSPGTIVSETNKVLLGLILGPAIIVSLLWIGSGLVKPLILSNSVGLNSAVVAIIISACFVAGTMPDVALRYIIQRDKLKNFKREEVDVFQAFKVTPVEIIDGIDSDIRARLEDHHIHSTQNLAAANPLMLFVETPFGVYQIMDWVAQAQLCCSVGRDKIIRLWPLGVRTLFDLERLAEGSDENNLDLLIEVGRVMLGTRLLPQDLTNRAAAAALIRTSIELRLDDPHVQRLRQIYIAVGDRLGSQSRRFRSKRYRIVCRRHLRNGWTCRGVRTARG